MILFRSAARAAACALVVLAAACQSARADAALSEVERRAIADTLSRQIAGAYDLSAGGGVARLMSLYVDSGRVVSASGGQLTTDRRALESGIRQFWDNVAANMRNATWRWDSLYVDVLSRDAAVLTGTYRIAHQTPAGASHVVGGAWTAVFVRRGGRWGIIQEHLSDPSGQVAAPPAAAVPPAAHEGHRP